MQLNRHSPRTPGGQIELTGVSYRPGETKPWALRDLDLLIPPGQSVALVGGPGCGDLLRLLRGHVRPQTGTVHCDGLAPSTRNLHTWERTGAVLAEDRLFNGDIFSNIAVTARTLTLEQAWEAVRLAGLEREVKAMPTGLHTMVGEHLGTMSPSQRQRLLLARAVAANPRILLLDETLLAPDGRVQRAVRQVMERMGCTRLVATRRPDILRCCQRILVLEDGQILRDGGYEELLATGALEGLLAALDASGK